MNAICNRSLPEGRPTSSPRQEQQQQPSPIITISGDDEKRLMNRNSESTDDVVDDAQTDDEDERLGTSRGTRRDRMRRGVSPTVDVCAGEGDIECNQRNHHYESILRNKNGGN